MLIGHLSNFLFLLIDFFLHPCYFIVKHLSFLFLDSNGVFESLDSATECHFLLVVFSDLLG